MQVRGFKRVNQLKENAAFGFKAAERSVGNSALSPHGGSWNLTKQVTAIQGLRAEGRVGGSGLEG